MNESSFDLKHSYYKLKDDDGNIVQSGFTSKEPQTITLYLNYYDIDTLVIDKEKGYLTITEKRKENTWNLT